MPQLRDGAKHFFIYLRISSNYAAITVIGASTAFYAFVYRVYFTHPTYTDLKLENECQNYIYVTQKVVEINPIL